MRGRFIPFILAAFGGAASAQIALPPVELPVVLPGAQLGVPYEANVAEGFEAALSLGNSGGATFTFNFTAPANLPAGLAASASGRISGTPAAAGTFNFTYAGTLTGTAGGISASITFRYQCTLVVTGQPGGMAVETGGISFILAAGSSETATTSVRVANRSATAREVSVSAATITGSGWLEASGGGSVGPYLSTTASVTASAAGLGPGVYLGSATLSSGSESFTVPVTLTVTSAQQALRLSQNGMSFEVESGSPAALTQTFQVGTSSGSLQFTVSAITISGGPWLQATPASGTATSDRPVPIGVRVSGVGLAPGQYHGQVEVSADAANSPAQVNVVLNVLPANANVAPSVAPTGLVFVQTPGATPAPQTITITNTSSRTLGIAVGASFESAPGWFSQRASAPTVAPGQTATITVTREAGVRLPAGVTRGEIGLRLAGTDGSNSSLRRITVVAVVLPTAAATQSLSRASQPRADGCTPARLVPVFTTLGTGFSVTAAWPTALETVVVDDCGDPLLRGAVTVSFNNGDPPVAMTPIGQGRWNGTWQPRGGSSNVVMVANAQTQSAPVLTGTAQMGGTTANNSTTPMVNSGGVVSGASFLKQGAVPTGGYIVVSGRGLATGVSTTDTLPLGTDLAGTQVILGGRRLPLELASEGQIRAVVPYQVPTNTQQQLVVRRGNILSMPEPVAIAASQPAVFTKDQSGKGEGVIEAINAEGVKYVVTAQAPTGVGEELLIYAAGLGPVEPPVNAGEAAPQDPLSATVTPVTATIGGVAAEVRFAGLAPGLTGRYVVRAVVPEGVASGPAEVVLAQGEQKSPPVTVAIR
jgi:uncharacterized protein (TIGR03437 family)